MWICKDCGFANEGRKVCKKCGAPVDKSGAQDNHVPSDIHDSRELTTYEINKELKRLIRHFNPLLSQFKEYNYCNQKLDFLSKKGYVPVAILILGIILSAISIFLIVMTFTVLFRFFNGLLIWWFMFLGLGIYCITVYIHSLLKNRKEIRKYITKEIGIAKQLTKSFDEAETDIIDVMYSDPRILEKIVNIISEGRANTVDKAVDALYVESGKTKEQSRRYLDLVASRQADYGGKDAAVFCSADFFGAYHMKK